MNFNEFKDKNKEFALSIDLKNEQPNVYEIYMQKFYLANGTDEIYDLQEILKFCKKAKRELMQLVNNHLIINYGKVKHIGHIAPVYYHLRSYLDYDSLLKIVEEKISICNSEIDELSTKNTINNDTVKNRYWFKIGLLFATGEINKYLEEKKLSCNKTAIEIGLPKARPYISDTYNNNKKIESKNIFLRSENDLKFLIEHCKDNGLNINEIFIKMVKSKHKFIDI